MKDLQCMSFVGKDLGNVIAAGRQNIMVRVDVEKGRVLDRVSYILWLIPSRLIGCRFPLSMSTQ